MDFAEQLKGLRADTGMTQEQIAARLNVTRQAVSNWENDRNLPDIEMLITIAREFGLSLDQLILGEKDMSNMADKLIKDGSETRRARMNLVSVCIGAALLIIGAGLLAIKAASVEYIDAEGVLHENFFLIPMAFLFLFSGFITFAVTGVSGAVKALKAGDRGAGLTFAAVAAGVVFMLAGGVLVLAYANSGISTVIPGAVVSGIGILALVFAAIRGIIRK